MKFKILILTLCLCAFVPSAFSFSIDNAPATNITRLTATLQANVLTTNGTNPTVVIYYGFTDGVTNSTNWTYSANLGVCPTGICQVAVSNLTPAMYYYFRAYGSETTNSAWAAATTNFESVAGGSTNTPPGVAFTIMVDSNGNLVSPAQFFLTNLDLMLSAGLASYSQITNFDFQLTAVSTRVDLAEGSISTNAARTLDLSNRVNIAEGNITTNTANALNLSNRVGIAEGNISTNAGNIATNVAAINTLSGRVDLAEGAISTNTANINNISNRLYVIETNYLVKATNAPISGYALYAEVGDGFTNQYWGPVSTNSSGGAITNQIMDVNGILYTITNAPGSNGWVLAFDPDTSNAYFTTNFDGSGGGGGMTYYADGSTLKLTDSTFSVAKWIPDNLLILRYETWNHFAAYSQGMIDGPGYWFDDQNGIISGLSSGYVFQTPGYMNKTEGAGTAGKALSLSGSQRWTNLVDNLPLANTGMTIAVWVNLADTNKHGAALAVYGTGAEGFGIGVGGTGQLQFDGNTLMGHNPAQAWLNSGKNIGTGWHLIGLSIGADRQYLWLDSTNVYTSVTVPITISEKEVSVGGVPAPKCDPETRFTGILDEPMVFSRELYSNDWASLYNAGAGLYGATNVGATATGLVWASHVDEGSGSTIADYSGGGVTLVEEGSSAWSNSTVCTTDYTPDSCNDMELVSTNLTLSFLPGYGYASVLVNPGTNVITTNNVKMFISRNYGTNYDEIILTMMDTWSISNKLFAGSVTLTNQPATSNVVLRVYCSSNAFVTVLGVAGPCSPE